MVRDWAGRAAAFVTTVLETLSGVGRAVVALGLGAWATGWWFGWREFLLLAGGCVVAVVAAVLFTLGRDRLLATLELSPQRVTMGETATGRVEVVNQGRRRVLPVTFEVPVGTGTARFELPATGHGERWDEVFVIPTTRRCVMTVGPASAVRGDPLGLARRVARFSEVHELYVHPVTTSLSGLTSGWIRDLEGRPTKDLSPSDVAFHTMREYVPGDDRRHIHWKSSARVGTLMVRQFVDSRRTHLGLILSTSDEHYGSADEFELAVSVVGSLGRNALIEDQAVSVTTGRSPLPSHNPVLLLDALAGVELAERGGDLQVLVKHSIPIVRGASVIVLVVGSTTPPAALRSGLQRFQHDAQALGVRVNPGADVSIQTVGSTSILEIGSLDQLHRGLRASVAA